MKNKSMLNYFSVIALANMWEHQKEHIGLVIEDGLITDLVIENESELDIERA